MTTKGHRTLDTMAKTSGEGALSMALLGMVIAVDFDGTCVTHEYPKIGRHVGAPRVLHRIVKEGGHLILCTMRGGTHLRDAVRWFEKNGIPLLGIQRHPKQYTWTDSPKCYADLYIDDAALGCPLTPGLKGERPYVDWNAVEAILWSGRYALEPPTAPPRSAKLASSNRALKLWQLLASLVKWTKGG
jgi:hypothetical protein